jgi:hypothetical protein
VSLCSTLLSPAGQADIGDTFLQIRKLPPVLQYAGVLEVTDTHSVRLAGLKLEPQGNAGAGEQHQEDTALHTNFSRRAFFATQYTCSTSICR